MIKLLNTLYVLSEDTYLALDGENVTVLRGGEILGRFPLHTLQSIEYFGYKGASPALMGECAARGISLSFYSGTGRYLVRIGGEYEGNVLLRREQYRVADDCGRASAIVKNFIVGKVFNSRWVLERATRDHPLQVNVESIKVATADLAKLIEEARRATSVDELRGIEGAAARSYFQQFNQLILRDKETFSFKERTRRPPKDPVNALLSFGYAMLANDCASALEGAGLDPYLGLMHVARPGRKSLALDLVEELRSVLADRIVLDCINNGMLAKRHFDWREDGSVLLNDEGRRLFVGAWQEKKREKLRHPYLQETIQWGLLPHVQAMLLARYLRGDIDQYPPFLWK